MRHFSIFLLAAAGIFVIDQGIKDIFVGGYGWYGECFSLDLHYNKGVAFSLFTSLAAYLKWIQAALITGIVVYLLSSGLIIKHPLLLGMLVGAALGNLYDRFVHEGVVDYLYWHCWFDYPVFNFADVVIDLAIVWLLIIFFRESKQSE